MVGHLRDQAPVGVELAHEAVTLASDVVLSALQGIRDEDRVTDRLDAERTVAAGNGCIREFPGGWDFHHRRVDELERFHLALGEIGAEERFAVDRQSLVGRFFVAEDLFGHRSAARIPGEELAVLARPDEERLLHTDGVQCRLQSGHRDHEGETVAVPVVDRGGHGAVVGDPPRATAAGGDAPRVLEQRVGLVDRVVFGLVRSQDRDQIVVLPSGIDCRRKDREAKDQQRRRHDTHRSIPSHFASFDFQSKNIRDRRGRLQLARPERSSLEIL